MRETENIAIGIGRVVQRRDEVLERRSGILRKLGEKRLGLLFCEGAHFDGCAAI